MSTPSEDFYYAVKANLAGDGTFLYKGTLLTDPTQLPPMAELIGWVLGTDKGLADMWDGTNWLGPAYSIPVQFAAQNNMPFAASEAGAFVAMLPQNRAVKVVQWDVLTNADLLGENDYWEVALKNAPLVGSIETMASFDNHADSSGNVAVRSITTFTNNPTAMGDYYLQIDLTKTGSPDTILIYSNLLVRDVYA